MDKNVAIKCTYNNGGEDYFVGFDGTCNIENIKRNIKNKRAWCSHKDNGCLKYSNSGFSGNPPLNPCMESVLFRTWEFDAGWDHPKTGPAEPRHLLSVKPEGIVLLTTRFPEDREIDRKIIGYYKIRFVLNPPGNPTRMVAYDNYRVRLPLEEAKQLYFWDYHDTKAGADWRTGLVRYLSDRKIANILYDLRDSLRDEEARETTIKLLQEDYSAFPDIQPRANGARQRVNSASDDRAHRVFTQRKYGAGGEGIDHKTLKEWVANNPVEIGLEGVISRDIEHDFVSGDIVDIDFTCRDNKHAVVEIETCFPYPGCHQALKYKVLKCAELGIDIHSPAVSAIVVAWGFSDQDKSFCDRYGIKYVQKRL